MQYKIPAGLRDTMPDQWQKKKALETAILDQLIRYGCQPIRTPAIEFYQTYARTFEDSQDREMFKFFDQNGDILVLRMDMTVPIARAATSKFNLDQPKAFCYSEDVFKVRTNFQGRRSQVTDCGAEFIGIPHEQDHEILLLAANVLEHIASSDWMLEISDVRFFQLAVQAAGLDPDQQRELAHLVDAKSIPDLERFLRRENIPHADFFLSLPMLAGKENALQTAMDLAFTAEMKEVVAQLDLLCARLEQAGAGTHISVDLAKIPHLNYYTGVIFEGYMTGSGFSVLSGGRYDHLLAKFGKDLPAIGFSCKLDYILDSQEATA